MKLFYLAGLLLFTSCASERNFVKFHDKQPDKAINYCMVWNPVHDSIHEQTFTIPGETVIVPGETIYADCDSAYQAALDEVAKSGVKIIVKKVAVPCPPSTVRVDMYYKERSIQIRYLAVEDGLKKQLNNQTLAADKYRKWAKGEAWALSVILLCGIVYVYAKISGKV